MHWNLIKRGFFIFTLRRHAAQKSISHVFNMLDYMTVRRPQINFRQEWIPVGCVPSAAVAVPWGRCLPRGVSGEGASAREVFCPGRVSVQGVSASQGVSAQGDVGLPGTSAQGGVCLSHPPMDRMTDTCKKHYLAATTLRTVITRGHRCMSCHFLFHQKGNIPDNSPVPTPWPHTDPPDVFRIVQLWPLLDKVMSRNQCIGVHECHLTFKGFM